MPTPMLDQPATEGRSTCSVCGSTLMWTGKTIPHVVESEAVWVKDPVDNKTRTLRGYKGYIPSLLVAVCPTCDVYEPTEVTAPEPELAVAKESYLERVARNETCSCSCHDNMNADACLGCVEEHKS